MLKYLIYALFIAILLAISIHDIKYKKIPDKLIVLLGITAILSAVFTDDVSITSRLIGMILISVLLIIIRIFSKGGIGGGDIKLMAVSGLLLGADCILHAVFFGAVLSVIVILVLLGFRKINRKSKIAFGPFLSIGIITTILFEMI